MGEADKRYSSVADSAGKKYASLAKLSLGQVYFAEGKNGAGRENAALLDGQPYGFRIQGSGRHRAGKDAGAHQAR